MIDFVLPKNYTENPEALLRKNRSYTTSSSTPSSSEAVNLAPSTTTSMAKSLREYSILAIANMLVGPTVNTGNGNFELRFGLITMV
jgi:hypothetical protein